MMNRSNEKGEIVSFCRLVSEYKSNGEAHLFLIGHKTWGDI